MAFDDAAEEIDFGDETAQGRLGCRGDLLDRDAEDRDAVVGGLGFGDFFVSGCHLFGRLLGPAGGASALRTPLEPPLDAPHSVLLGDIGHRWGSGIIKGIVPDPTP